MTARSLGARSYCKYAVKVTLTFATLQRNRGSRAQTHKNSMVFVNFCVGPGHDCQAASDAQMSGVETRQMSSVETGQMSAVETGQMSAVETRQMSAVETRQTKVLQNHCVFLYLSSRPPIPLQSGEGRCHFDCIFTRTSRTQAPRAHPRNTS